MSGETNRTNKSLTQLTIKAQENDPQSVGRKIPISNTVHGEKLILILYSYFTPGKPNIQDDNNIIPMLEWYLIIRICDSFFIKDNRYSIPLKLLQIQIKAYTSHELRNEAEFRIWRVYKREFENNIK